ncbi:MAG: hypothetical protein A2151_06650 [Candidatus Muproteobacteria bacterium RBG_16_65_34]|uniref:DUF4340 domain-containing protein n=1 Tax=Candidatus Muproteobacteria bacterium RBG_16_65_34 TaxID=1817760 RepID=A0A1F6TVP3_9PROT|nr:MAG: hypothetical protein A2151_06650 [Candidatus Muproteobacteria bacterium RBG_16_65_34]
MHSRWLLNLGLLVLVAGLALLAVFRPGPQQDAAGPPLTALDPESVARVRIEKPDREPGVLEKSAGAWRLTSPVPARANRFNVEALLRLARAPVAARLPAGEETSQYGFDSPQARVWLGDEEIVIGGLHPFKNQHYVRYKNETVLIPSHHVAVALYPYGNFIDSRLIEEELKPVAIRLPGFTLTLKDGAWQKTPRDEKLTTDRIHDFVAEWRNARALSVERYSGKPALKRVIFTLTKNGKTENLVLGILAYEPDFILYRPDEGLEYHFPEEIGKRLLRLSAGED